MTEEKQRLKSESEKMAQVRAAYNADKRALVDKIEELEAAIRKKELEKIELESKINMMQ